MENPIFLMDDLGGKPTMFGNIQMFETKKDVSENSVFSPQIIHFNKVFHYKPSILGVPLFLEPSKKTQLNCHVVVFGDLDLSHGGGRRDVAIDQLPWHFPREVRMMKTPNN